MNKRGFTLIELLAVIVILAIIALIATPIVLNIIKDSRDSAGLRSAEMYLKGLETSVATSTINNKKVSDGTYQIMQDGNICLVEIINNTCSEDNTLHVEMNGEKPESGSVTIEAGKITDIELKYTNQKTIVKSDGKLVYGGKEETEEVKTIDTICIHDETNGVAKNTAGAKYSCEVKPGTSYNFYVLTTPKDGDTTINLIMDRNICEDGSLTEEGKTCLVEWISDEKYYEDVGGVIPDNLKNDDGMCQNGGICKFNDKGPVTAMDYLYKATKDWIDVPNIKINYTDEGNIGDYGYGTIITTNGVTKITKKDLTTVTSSYKDLKARLPYKSELGEYDSKTKSNAYLYDYLDQSGTIQTNVISNIYGYWTLSSDSDSSYSMGIVNKYGYASSIPVYLDGNYGVRAVITLKL